MTGTKMVLQLLVNTEHQRCAEVLRKTMHGIPHGIGRFIGLGDPGWIGKLGSRRLREFLHPSHVCQIAAAHQGILQDLE